MAYIQDSTKTFTITLFALLEGLGILTGIAVTNDTQGITYRWTPSGWDPSTPEAIEGDYILISPNVINNGATTDTLWIEFSSAQVTTPNLLKEKVIAVGETFVTMFPITMPAQNVSIIINAGHVE